MNNRSRTLREEFNRSHVHINEIIEISKHMQVVDYTTKYNGKEEHYFMPCLDYKSIHEAEMSLEHALLSLVVNSQHMGGTKIWMANMIHLK